MFPIYFRFFPKDVRRSIKSAFLSLKVSLQFHLMHFLPSHIYWKKISVDFSQGENIVIYVLVENICQKSSIEKTSGDVVCQSDVNRA